MQPVLDALGLKATVLLMFGVLLAGATIVTLCGLLGMIVFGPLRRRAEKLRTPTQFQLSDFFWLVVQLQVALVYSVRSVGIEQLAYFLLVFGFLLLATVAMWAGAMSFMTRAGVMQPQRRAVFILFLLPLTLALMIGSSFLVVVMPASFFVDRLTGDGVLSLYLGTTDLLRQGPYKVAALVAGMVAATWGLRRLSVWILLDSQSPVTETPAARIDVEPPKSTAAPLGGA